MRKWIIGVVVAAVIIIIYMFTAYNGMVTSQEAINNQWAQVQAQYQRRFDLIPNLVESVKGAQKQEQTIFSDLANARAHYSGATSPQDQVQAANQVESALGRLLVVVENYRTLASNQTVQTLMVQLEGTENRINVERMRYNDSVQSYNLRIRRFPGSILARLYGFTEKAYFQADLGSQKAPQVKLQ